eukprot:12955861-Alexandrium_andersonii.AAC.1
MQKCFERAELGLRRPRNGLGHCHLARPRRRGSAPFCAVNPTVTMEQACWRAGGAVAGRAR